MTRKRSKYRPKGVIFDTMGWVKGGFKPITAHTDTNILLRMKCHGAIAALLKAEATKFDLDVLINASNMATALRNVGKCVENLPEIRAGADAIEALQLRRMKTGRLLCWGPEQFAIRRLMEIHDKQLDKTSVLEMEKAIAIAKKGIASTPKEESCT